MGFYTYKVVFAILEVTLFTRSALSTYLDVTGDTIVTLYFNGKEQTLPNRNKPKVVDRFYIGGPAKTIAAEVENVYRKTARLMIWSDEPRFRSGKHWICSDDHPGKGWTNSETILSMDEATVYGNNSLGNGKSFIQNMTPAAEWISVEDTRAEMIFCRVDVVTATTPTSKTEEYGSLQTCIIASIGASIVFITLAVCFYLYSGPEDSDSSSEEELENKDSAKDTKSVESEGKNNKI